MKILLYVSQVSRHTVCMFVHIYIYIQGVTAVCWLELLTHSQKDRGSNLRAGWVPLCVEFVSPRVCGGGRSVHVQLMIDWCEWLFVSICDPCD